MATTINKTNGSVLTTIPDGAVDLSSTNIALIGRLYRNYGELVNENLVKLLENFANATSPSTPIVGQLWFDTVDRKIKVYRSTGFVSLGVTTTSTTEPSNPAIGDLWYDTVDAQLKTYTGSSWTVIAPGYTASQGKTGAFAETILDTLSNNHIAVLVYQSGQVISTFSNDNEYTPSTAITGFTSIKKGITLSSTVGTKVHGTATNAELLDSIDSTQFIRSDENDVATGTLTLTNAQPLVLGPNNTVQINITTTNADIVKVNSGNIRFYTDNTELVMQLNDNKQIVAEQGSASTPSITFNGDTDTGLNWISSNTLGIAAGGTNRLTVSTTGANVNGTLSAGTIASTGNASVAGTLSAGAIVSTGNASVIGTLAVDGNSEFTANLTVSGTMLTTVNETVTNNLFVNNELLVRYNSGSGVSALRVDSSNRVMINVAGVAVAASSAGDVTLGPTAHVYAANTAKWWAVWKDNTNAGQFAFLGEHHVDSITRESAAGEYKINLDYAMTAASYWAVVGMGAYGNMNMLEFPVAGSYVRVKNELYDYTATRDSSYNSVVAFGV
jgi:hypothetical protein